MGQPDTTGSAGMTKLLYVAGWGRSGTTLLDNLLGQLEGFVSTGELHNLWHRGLEAKRECGCGLPLLDCPFWNRALLLGFGGIENIDVTEVITAQRALTTRTSRKILNTLNRSSVLETYPYATHLKDLYSGIQAATGARVIVDSSKFPADAILAAGLPSIETYVIHMVRDPRAVAFSWTKTKAAKDKPTGFLRRTSAARSTLVWNYYNFVIDSYVRKAVPGRYLVLRYEDLVSDPEGSLQDIVALLGETVDTPTLSQDRSIELEPSHTASGNPDRFRTGWVSIIPDDGWMRQMARLQRMVVTALALPLLRRYKYPLSISGLTQLSRGGIES